MYTARMQYPKYENVKKYLPSKTFASVIGLLILGLIIIVVLSSIFGSKKFFNRGSLKAHIDSEGTVGDVITRDSNNNGITDWEETLWGLDPKGDGTENKKAIDAKKLAQNIPLAPEKTPEELTQTETFSQDLLSTILALNQAGALNEGAINTLAETIGGSVDAKHADVKTYVLADLHTSTTSTAKATYKTALKKVIDGYDAVNFGDELSIIATGLGSGGAGQLSTLDTYITAYANLSKQVLALTTPTEIAPIALQFINSSAKMSASLAQVRDFYTDVLAGMVGLDDYTKAKDESDKASLQLAKYFER